MSTVPGGPLDENLMIKPDFPEELRNFSKEGSFSLHICLGPGSMLIFPKDSKFANLVTDKLLSFNPEIGIEEIPCKVSPNEIAYFKRGNEAYTRKKIMPMVKAAIGSC